MYAAPETGVIPMTGNVIYYRTSSELKYGDATYPTDIRELTVGGVTIGGQGGISGRIIAKNIVGIKNTVESTPSDISINGATFANGGAITATSLKLNGMDDVKTAIEAKAAKTDVDNNKANISDLQTSKADAANVYTKIESDSRFAGKTYEGKVDVLEATVNDTSTGLVKKVGDLETKTTDISYDSTTGTTIGRVDGVTFNAGAVSGVKSINGKIEISADGKTVTFNRGETNGQVEISAAGIKVGTGSTYIKGDAIYTGDANYDNAKAGMKSDGSLKAANGNFTVEGATGNTTVGGTLSVAGETTFANGIKTDTIVEKTANAGVTVNGNKITTDKKFNGVELNGGNVKATDITAAGALKGQTLGIGAANTEFVVDANGNITKVTSITADQNKLSTIGGVKLEGKKVTADNLEIDNKITTKDLKVNGSFEVGDFTTNNLKVNNTLTVGIDTTLTDGKLVLGTDAQHTLTKEKLKSINDTINNNGEIETTKATIGVNTTIDSTGIRSNSVTADTGTIGGITLNSNNISGVTMVTAGEFNVNGNNFLNSTGITASKGKIGEVTIENKEVKADKFTAGASSLAAGNLEIDHQNSWTNTGIQANDIKAGSATIGTNTKIDSTGIVTNKVTLGDMTITDGNISRTNGVTINGVELKTNAVTASGGFTVDTQNKLDATGLTAKAGTFADSVTIGSSSTNQTKVEQGKITVKGTAGRSTAAETETTIDGGVITTDTLNVQRIELGEKLVDTTGSTITDSSIYLDHDGSFGAAKGAFQIDKDGQVKNNITVSGADASETTFTSSKTGITAKYRKGTGTATSGLTIEDNHAALNASGGAALDLKDKTATLGIGTDSLTTYTSDTIESKVGTTTVTTKSGGTTFGDGTANNTLINGSSITSTKDGTFTTINGSSVRSYNSATGAGHLNGATLNLWKDSDNATYMTAGGATFTKDGKTTIISGDTITTGTLNVKDIVLGGTMYDATGHPLDGKLSIGNDGHLRAANGNFDVKDDGTFKNTVGNTTLQTDTTGASMKFDNNATTGGIKSEVAVADDSAKISAGASSIEVKNDGITNNGVTTFNGTTGTTTKIDGGTITTNHLITDKLTITGSGNAEGLDPSDPDYRGSIAFGGNGSITSNIKDGTKEVTFKTDKTGTFTEAKDGSNVTTNTVNAQGNTNVVTDGTNTSTATQTATSIGGVVTNGTVKMSQELTADGVKFEQTGYDEVNIAKGDVTVKNNRNTATPNQEVHLSDLGSLNNLDGELAARDEYTDNKTAVGAINAEAGIRREEVTRLDGRINDVNDRVNKVGAMAAAIASLKSIGYDPQAPSEFSIGLGQYKGETGVAMGFFHYPNKNFMINVSLSTAGGETMGGIGATWRFGHKSPQKLLEEQREAQAKKELAAAEKYQAAAKLAKEAQERAEYAAKLARQAQVSADNAKAAADATQAKHFG